jgi:SlyX protein
MDQTEQRLSILEEHAAHQARTIEELSDQLASQWQLVSSLQMKLDRLTERFHMMEDAAMEAPAITRPPHY